MKKKLLTGLTTGFLLFGTFGIANALSFSSYEVMIDLSSLTITGAEILNVIESDGVSGAYYTEEAFAESFAGAEGSNLVARGYTEAECHNNNEAWAHAYSGIVWQYNLITVADELTITFDYTIELHESSEDPGDDFNSAKAWTNIGSRIDWEGSTCADCEYVEAAHIGGAPNDVDENLMIMGTVTLFTDGEDIGYQGFTLQIGCNWAEGQGVGNSWGAMALDSSPPNIPIPEPSSMLLLGTGLIGLAGFRKKFKK